MKCEEKIFTKGFNKFRKCKGFLICIVLLLSCSSVKIIKKGNNSPLVRSQESIQKETVRMANKLKMVYEDALKRDSTIYGKLNVKFVVQPNGTVTDLSKIICTITDTQFVSAVIDRISNWKFPAIKNGDPIEIIYPFIFKFIKNN